MNQFIYYPYFEPSDKNWLKYALLYIDKLSPIVPLRGSVALSALSIKLDNETDFLDYYRPNYYDGQEACLEFIYIIEKIFKNSNYEVMYFNQKGVLDSWRIKNNWKFEIFREKYSFDFIKFCINNKLGLKSDNGIIVHPEFGSFYLMVLAQFVADKNYINVITDDYNLNEIGLNIKNKHDGKKTIKHQILSTTVIDRLIPQNINEITFDRIIKLRNQQNFKAYLKAYNNALDDFLNSKNEVEAEKFLCEYNKIYEYFKSEMLILGATFIPITVSIYSIYKCGFDSLQLLNFTASSLRILASYISINNKWKNLKSRRYCKKYLSSLKKV